jgi:hypothetical protein
MGKPVERQGRKTIGSKVPNALWQPGRRSNYVTSLPVIKGADLCFLGEKG